METFVAEAHDENNYKHLSTDIQKSWKSINHKKSWFRQVLTEVKSDQHPSLQYFIFKSIILNNLYGVDIMNEAVEIAKLRLFLKLVATVDVNPRKDNFGLEPLPDIDFNIRAGNTLIGFATENELLQTIQRKEPLFAQDKLEEFKEEFELVSKAFGHFQNSQLINDQGRDSFKQAKAQLVSKLKELNHKLNVYLATNYGIDAERKPKEYQAWLHSHQPFHWFAEFYQIVAACGGFDCIVGNPPYVQTSDVDYKILFESTNHSNLYAYVQLRCVMISNSLSYCGLIVPMSISGIRDYSELRTKLAKSYKSIYVTNHAIRPQSLFEGISQRVSIVLAFEKGKKAPFFHSTKYLRTKSTRLLFQQIQFATVAADLKREGLIPKLSTSKEVDIWEKINSVEKVYSQVAVRKEESFFIKDYGETYWVFPFKFSPYLTPLKSFKELKISKSGINSTFCFFNSTLHYFFYSAISDCWHFGIWHLKEFPYSTSLESRLIDFSNNLEHSYKENRIIRYDRRANGYIYEYKISKSKPIIDQIDTVLAEHYGFTEAELDFIINYDIKYRMGKALFGEAEVESEEDED